MPPLDLSRGGTPFAAPVVLPTGTAANPPLQFTDGRLGFYQSGTASIGVSVAGVNVATFDINGISISTANALVLMTAVANALPTTLPATAGVLWNNGGVLCLS